MFVKPNAIVRDNRAEDVKDAELAESTSRNLFYIQKQLLAQGSSLEAVLCAATKAHHGVNVAPHAPVEKEVVEDRTSMQAIASGPNPYYRR